MRTFEPHLEILPVEQRAVLDALADVPADLVLYGGTALALRLGHRRSVDFDFFSDRAIDRPALGRLFASAEVLDESPNGLTMSIDRGVPVKVSFSGGIDFGRVGHADSIPGRSIRVASLLDLGGTKVKALLQRVESKDYQDIAALLRAGVPMADILGAARALFGASFNPLVARKALAFFEGGDLDRLGGDDRATLTDAALADLATTDMVRVSATLA